MCGLHLDMVGRNSLERTTCNGYERGLLHFLTPEKSKHYPTLGFILSMQFSRVPRQKPARGEGSSSARLGHRQLILHEHLNRFHNYLHIDARGEMHPSPLDVF